MKQQCNKLSSFYPHNKMLKIKFYKNNRKIQQMEKMSKGCIGSVLIEIL